MLFLPLVLACNNDAPPASAKPVDTHQQLAGVYPERFTCDSIVTAEALGPLLGGSARVIDTPISVPHGLPHPCNYEITTTAGAEYWTFDIDCRDGMKQRADALFAQYAQTSADTVQQYNAMADAGVKGGEHKAAFGNDAGVVYQRPEGAAEVAVGAKGLDHHGQGLIFIDDDAPCYVRVVGPDAIRRLDLAKLIAKNLTFANAPMTPRPMR